MTNGTASDAKAGDAELQPVAHDAQDFSTHVRIVHVEIRLEVVEHMIEVLARQLVVRPHRLLHAREHHALVPTRRPLLRPDVPVAQRRFRIAPRSLKPRMLVRSVIDDQVDDHADAALVRLVHELDELAARAVARIDAVEIGDVVAVVAIRRGLERCEPDDVDAERVEIVETLHQTAEIAAAVAVTVHERFKIEAVDDRVLVPEVGDHSTATHPTLRWLRTYIR
jgi:hypothetical protein